MTTRCPYLGLDVGTRRIGVAKSDAGAQFAMPHETVDASSGSNPARYIAELIERVGCHTVVVGWPLTLEGAEGRAVRRVQTFVDRLEAVLEDTDSSVTFCMWDERMTTTAAESFLIEADVSRGRRKKVVDQIAAHHILQGYLDSLDGDDQS